MDINIKDEDIESSIKNNIKAKVEYEIDKSIKKTFEDIIINKINLRINYLIDTKFDGFNHEAYVSDKIEKVNEKTLEVINNKYNFTKLLRKLIKEEIKNIIEEEKLIESVETIEVIKEEKKKK